MNNINILMKITFDNPYLLFLIIPLIAIAFIPYLKLKPKRRHTRNKVTSLILHCLIILLACVVLTGIEGHNTEYVDSEIIFVNDYSDSTKDSQQGMNDYVHQFLDDPRNSGSKVGLVNFGYGDMEFTPELVKPKELKDSVDYLISRVDKTGTNIEAAITKAVELFDNETKLIKRIILLTDAMDTDGDISGLATILNKNNIRLDAIYFSPKDYNDTFEAQISQLEVANDVVPFKETTISVSFKSHSMTSVRLTITDNGKSIFTSGNSYRDLALDGRGNGFEQTFDYKYTFDQAGIHELKAEISALNSNDLVKENNIFYSYVYLESENSILIVAPDTDEKASLTQAIESYGFTPNVVTPRNAPTNLGDLTKYKEVILMNSNVASFNPGFAQLLKQYVEKAGGSVLTAGGDNTYINGNMRNTPIEEMLPIKLTQEANNPRAIVICLDYSNSMGMYAVNGSSLYGKTDAAVRDPDKQTGETRIKTAIKSIVEAIRTSLNPYDYLGLITFGGASSSEVNNGYGGDTKIIFGLTRATQKDEMIEKIYANVKKDNDKGGTCYDSALQYAGEMLSNTGDVKFNSKTVILVNDYDASNDHVKTYIDTVKGFKEKKISLQSIVIGNQHTDYVQNMSNVWPEKNKIYHTTNPTEFANIVKELCKSIPTKPVTALKNEGKFEFMSTSRVHLGADINNLPNIKTYNGGITVKDEARTEIFYHNQEIVYDEDGRATEDFYDNNDPIYAEWTYGAGKVGSLMIDLSSNWCPELFTNVNTQIILENIITGLIPKQDVDIIKITVDGFLLEKEDETLTIKDSNYSRRLEVELLTGNDDEDDNEENPSDIATNISMKVSISKFDAVENKTIGKATEFTLSSSTGSLFAREFETREPGLYRIHVVVTEDGNKIGEKYAYTTFSYSDEYDTFIEPLEKSNQLAQLCRSTFTESDGEKINGNMIPSSAGYEHTTDRLTTKIDTVVNIQLPLLIIALLLFVLDIAVRKFNFLWPHELYKKYVKKEDLDR